MQRVIKVYEKDSDNFIANEKYFYSLNKAKKYFKGLIHRHKKELVREDERELKTDSYLESEYQLLTRKGKGRFKLRRLEINNEDIFESPNEIIEIRLEEIKVE